MSEPVAKRKGDCSKAEVEGLPSQTKQRKKLFAECSMCDQLTEAEKGPRAEFGTRAGGSRSGCRGPTQRRAFFRRSGRISRTLIIKKKSFDHNEGGGWAWPAATTKEAATGREAEPNGNSTLG